MRNVTIFVSTWVFAIFLVRFWGYVLKWLVLSQCWAFPVSLWLGNNVGRGFKKRGSKDWRSRCKFWSFDFFFSKLKSSPELLTAMNHVTAWYFSKYNAVTHTVRIVIFLTEGGRRVVHKNIGNVQQLTNRRRHVFLALLIFLLLLCKFNSLLSSTHDWHNNIYC